MSQQQQTQQETIELKGEISGHNNWVTSIATTPDDPDMLITGSRDKTIIVWKLDRQNFHDEQKKTNSTRIVGKMVKRLVGHNHFVSDVCISSDRRYVLSSSWDSTLRLWNLENGETTKRFVGHKKDVLSVAFSSDNRQIVSGSRDGAINVWNTIGINKHVLTDKENGHNDWVTCVRFSPNVGDPVVVSAGRDKLVKVWETRQFKLKHNLKGHQSYVNSVTVSPDGSLCASGGKEGHALLWDLNEGRNLSSLDAGGEIYSLCFSPNRYWLCGAVGSEIKIWDLETKEEVAKLEPKWPEPEETEYKRKKKTLPILCTSLAWSQDGKTLFAGHTDNKIRVWYHEHSKGSKFEK